MIVDNHHSVNISYKFYNQSAILCMTQLIFSKALQDESY